MNYEHDSYENNNYKYSSQTTPSENSTICRVTIPPKYVCPVIFIPGIMGSNIMHENGEKVWFPPNGVLSGLGAAIGGAVWRSASDRQKELDPEKTHVSNEGEIGLKKFFVLNKLKNFNEQKARDRGWGTVWWTGYGDILIYLEKYLNQELVKTKSESENDTDCFMGTEEWEKIVDLGENSTSKLGELKQKWNPNKDSSFDLLTKKLHGKLTDYSFPVFALGYNWLQSNDKSADIVVDRILNNVQKQIKTEFPKQKFKKYIIVTHSMGGLVTRSLINNPKIKDDILGVVHGVMPASGAPTVYQRLCNGWDGFQATGKVLDAVAKYVFGASSEKLTPVLGNACGGLQLLPFANFQTDDGRRSWLKLKALDLNGKEIIAELPTNDPYKDIYRRTDTWWSMVDPNSLDPANILQNKADTEEDFTTPIGYYLKNIQATETFHKVIADKYHPNTYAHYGDDAEFKAFSEVLWETKQKIDIKNEKDLIDYIGKSINSIQDERPKTSEKQKYESYDEGQIALGGPVRIKNDENKMKEEKNMGRLETIVVQVEESQDWFTADGLRTVTTEKGEKISFLLRVKPTSSGDGTVCHESGADVKRAKIKNYFVMKGFEHSASYANKEVQINTLYNIAKVMEKL